MDLLRHAPGESLATHVEKFQTVVRNLELLGMLLPTSLLFTKFRRSLTGAGRDCFDTLTTESFENGLRCAVVYAGAGAAWPLRAPHGIHAVRERGMCFEYQRAGKCNSEGCRFQHGAVALQAAGMGGRLAGTLREGTVVAGTRAHVVFREGAHGEGLPSAGRGH
jgi:hypothetical protein